MGRWIIFGILSPALRQELDDHDPDGGMLSSSTHDLASSFDGLRMTKKILVTNLKVVRDDLAITLNFNFDLRRRANRLP